MVQRDSQANFGKLRWDITHFITNMRFVNIVAAFAMATVAQAFVVPPHTANGVYAVTIGEDGQEVHTRISDSTNLQSIQPDGVTTVKKLGLLEAGRIWCGCGFNMDPRNCDAAVESLVAQMGILESLLALRSSHERRQAEQNQEFNIRVFGHVIYENETREGGYLEEPDIKGGVEELNANFARHGVSFTYFNTSYNNDAALSSHLSEDDVSRTTKAYRRGHYADLNLFFLSRLQNINWSGVCTLPNEKYFQGDSSLPTKDGCFLLGHWLGLYHTFEDCDVGDFVEDTAPQEKSTNDTPDSLMRNNKSEVFQCGAWQPSNRFNFMDYSNAKGLHFTDGQVDRIKAYAYLRDTFKAEPSHVTDELDFWSGCAMQWTGPKSFDGGFTCERSRTEKDHIACVSEATDADSAERFDVKANCPLKWNGPDKFQEKVVCEELSFNHFRCKPDNSTTADIFSDCEIKLLGPARKTHGMNCIINDQDHRVAWCDDPRPPNKTHHWEQLSIFGPCRLEWKGDLDFIGETVCENLSPTHVRCGAAPATTPGSDPGPNPAGQSSSPAPASEKASYFYCKEKGIASYRLSSSNSSRYA
ncbi:hypothetical protein ED733_002829 [Metarhizium rileyi]|uniref:Peptidase M43 pregnancy-associated plasma-A domain-containing protein n=1 Tax=Metarhizium rileyi (strain RCEF 4871) TaxID=1649241 RepID=A0A5C6G1B7_METRR|nr:hypothetical protein ED733_002829 [Metarhizium rileyi]